MRIRLFWQLIIAFAILIVTGIGGTMALIGATFRQIYTNNLPTALRSVEATWSASLADYYVAHGESWVGVEPRLDDMTAWNEWLPTPPMDYVLVSPSGTVVAQRGVLPPRKLTPNDGSPIVVDGTEVGRLTVVVPGERFAERAPPWQRDGDKLIGSDAAMAVRPEGRDIGREVGRAFLGVALTLGTVMLGLAVFVSRRISAPLGKVNAAARRVAGGDLSVKVPGSSISELDTLATSFNQMTVDLRNADELRRNMTADIAHELRTPLTIIKGKLEGIIDGVYDANTDNVGLVLEEANLLERLIDDLRILSLAEAGRLPLYAEDLAVADVLGDAVGAFAAEATSHGIALERGTVPPDVRVLADPQRMQQVLGNLLSNSLRYTPAGGRVRIAASADATTVRIIVGDTGQGIAPDDLPSIFERFYRSDKARSHHGQGAGLGLAIARQLTEAQGGNISAASTLGAGTTMTVEMPRFDGERA